MSSQYYSATAYVGTPHRNEVEVTIPLVGPAGPQGPAGTAGASAWSDITGKPETFPPSTHTHGNLTNAGAIGTTANLPVKTGTSGVLEAGAFGTAAGQFAEGNHTHAAADITSGVLDNARINFAAPAAIGNTTAAAGSFTTLSATGAVTGAVAGNTAATNACNGFQIPVPAAGGSSAVGMYGAFSSGSARAVIFGAGSSGSTSTIADFSASGLVCSSIQNTPIGSTTAAAGTFTTLTANNGTLTASAPVLDLAQTWNASGVTFTGMRFNAAGSSDANSAVASNLAEFQVGGTNRLAVRKDGCLVFGTGNVSIFTSGGGASLGTVAGGTAFYTGTALQINNQITTSNSNTIQFGDPAVTTLIGEATNALAVRRSTNAQEFRVYGTITSPTNYQRLTIKTKAVTLSALSGASVATTGGFIPDGAVLVGLTTRVSTAITGATGYDIGDGSDADRWGANVAIALNTSSDNTNWTATTIQCFTAAQEVTLTAVGSNFTGGAVQIVAHYLAGEAD